MKKILTLIILFSSFLYANINVVVSIVPQKVFVKAIGGEKVNVALMVKSGSSPHTYEPKPSQMKDIANAKLYFSIGVEFDEVWLEKFKNQNKNMRVIDLSKNIKKLKIIGHSHGEHHDKHDAENLDPHIWTSPTNVKLIAKDIFESLVEFDKLNESYYKANYDDFIAYVDNVDIKIKKELIGTPNGSKFMVFHPSWGYFAKEYALEQFAIEIEGKSPKPKQLSYIIDEAREEGVKAIFTAPEFSDKVSKLLAKELNIKVIKVSPLSENWGENLIGLAKAIANVE